MFLACRKMKTKFRLLLPHILFWAIYAVSEYYANVVHIRPEQERELLLTTLRGLPVVMLPAYFLRYFAVPRYLKSNRWFPFLLWILAACLIVLQVRIRWMQITHLFDSGPYFPLPVGKVLKNVIRDYSIIALAVCLGIIKDWRWQQRQNLALVKAKAQAELQQLKNQLHPHFLFNSLNNLYTLALEKSDLTADAILKLTELLDYLVYWAKEDVVTLAKEVTLLDSYLDLERLRSSADLLIKRDFSIEDDEVKIAPVLLLPFVENCFKHGGPGADGIFAIRILLSCRQGQLKFIAENTKKAGRHTPAGGVGLSNSKKRLDLTYPGGYQLDISDQADRFHVALQISIK